MKFSWFSIGYVDEKWIGFDIIYFSVDHVFRTNRIARIPTVQGTIPMPSRPSAADCTALIRYGQHPSNTRTVYGRTCIQVRCSALGRPSKTSDLLYVDVHGQS